MNKKNIVGYNQIYIFNEYRNFNFKNIKNVEESTFPFTFEYVKIKLKTKIELVGFTLNL